MWGYSERVRDHFFNPRNAGILADANAVGEAGSLSSGDALKLMLRIDPQTGVIEAARFLAFGCGTAIATSSALTEMVIGKTIGEARRLTNRDIAARLGGLPPEKMHCSVMGQEALAAAVADWQDEARGELLAEGSAAMVAEDAVAPGAPPKAAAPARSDVPTSEPVTIRPLRAGSPVPQPPARARTPADEAIVVSRIIEDMRPIFHADGGDVTLLDIAGDRVSVKMSGACAGCQIASLTLGGLRKRIVAELGREVFVVPAARN